MLSYVDTSRNTSRTRRPPTRRAPIAALAGKVIGPLRRVVERHRRTRELQTLFNRLGTVTDMGEQQTLIRQIQARTRRA